MPRRASLKGKGADIFYPNGEDDGTQTAPASPPTAAPEEETAPPPPKKRTTRKPRASKPQDQPPVSDAVAKAAVAAETPSVKTPATITIATPPPATPVTKVPPSVKPVPLAPPSEQRTPPSAARSTPLPSFLQPTPPAPAPGLTTSDRYDHLASEIDDLYEIATRKIAAGRGVGQSMQWLRDARRLVLGGKSADYAESELLVMRVRGILTHGDEIDRLYTQVLDLVGDSPSLTQECMKRLQKARKKITKGDLSDLVEAESLMEEVKGILARVKSSRAASNAWRTRLLWFWLMGWLVVFLLVFTFDKQLAEALAKVLTPSISPLPSSLAYYLPPWLCLIWGGIGSVFDTLAAINKHVAERTYDGYYIPEAFSSPIIGAILGSLIYFLFTGGMVALSTGVGVTSSATTLSQDMQVAGSSFAVASRSLVLWTLAFLAGFFHVRTLKLLETLYEQFLSALKILPKQEPETPASPPSEPDVTTPAATPTGTPFPAPSPAPVVPPPAQPAMPVTQPLPPEGPPPYPAAPLPSPGVSPGPPEGPPPGETEIGNI